MKNGPYELVVAPDGYPGKRYRGRYAYEHRVRYWQAHGELPEVVHHKNEKKRDNLAENLQEHTRSGHTVEHALDHPAALSVLSCDHCGDYFMRLTRTIREKVQLGQLQFYCTKSHAISAQHKRLRGGVDFVHNSSGYNRGCRCDVCRAANTERKRSARSRTSAG